MGSDDDKDMRKDVQMEQVPVSILTNKLHISGTGPVPVRDLRSSEKKVGGGILNTSVKENSSVPMDNEFLSQNKSVDGNGLVSMSSGDGRVIGSRNISFSSGIIQFPNGNDDGASIISDANGITVERKASITSPKSTISFTVDENEKTSHHRYSISSKPGKSTTSIDSLATEGKNNSIDAKDTVKGNTKDEVEAVPEQKNSIVNMPGDFIFFESRKHEHNSNETDGKEKSLKSKKSGISGASGSKEVIGSTSGPQIPFSEYFLRQDDKKFHILIGATGSVATIKVPLIIDKLLKLYTPDKISIQLIVTKPAEHFLNGLKISTHVKIWREEDVWSDCKKMGDMILHHELRKWADIFLIVPLSANSLAKIANGISNNLLTAVLRDWSPNTPIYAAPAMNTFMYINPMTKKHLNILASDMPYITVLKPVEKVLICGDIGMGGMREWSDIVEIVRKKINEIKKARDEDTTTPEKDEDEDEEEADDEDEDESFRKNETDSEDDDDDDEEEEDDDDDDEDEEDGHNVDKDRMILKEESESKPI